MAAEPAQKDLLLIAVVVGLLLLVGFVLVNRIFLAPIADWNSEQAEVHLTRLAVFLVIVLFAILVAVSWTVSKQSNTGYWLVAALTGEIVFGTLASQMAFFYIPVYLAAGSRCACRSFSDLGLLSGRSDQSRFWLLASRG